MKTNVVMVRKMGEFDVGQRIQDGYFNATLLLKQWNHKTGMQKKVSHFFELQATKDFIEVLNNEVNSIGRNHGDNNISDSYILTKGNKSKGIDDQVWMHPYLFIDFAMWINPRFKLEVIRFVYDQLIQYRHSAGDNYRGLTSAVTRFSNVNFIQLAKGLNYIVFGRHDEGLRQTASQQQLHGLTELQRQLAFAVDMGYIRSFDELINEMRRIYQMKKSLMLQ
jgi:hypothetical protein